MSKDKKQVPIKIKYATANGDREVCGPNCHDSTRPGCVCICMGLNHGVGAARAADMYFSNTSPHPKINPISISYVEDGITFFGPFKL